MGRCQLITGSPKLSVQDLTYMTDALGVETICVFTPALCEMMKEAMTGNKKLLKILARLRRIDFGGAEIAPVLSEWGFEQKIKLAVSFLL
jgi:carbonic anhydrase